jgi:hypothetical protein
MKRIFGAKKEPAKTPTLDEATDNLTKRGDAYVPSPPSSPPPPRRPPARSLLRLSHPTSPPNLSPPNLSTQPPPSPPRSLDEKIRKLDEQLLKHRAGLRALRPGPALEAAKRRALVVLKQRRLYEGQRDQLYQQQANVDGAAFTMQSMQDTVQVVQAMQAGSKAMATMMRKNKELQVDKIWKTMDGLADLQADFEEIQVR